MRTFILFLGLSIISFSADAQIGKFLDKVNKSELGKKILGGDELDISGGLKEALQVGVEEAVNRLSAEDGYLESPYKIILPEEARKVVDKLKIFPGFSDVERNLVEKMNAAAESAAKKATPIFTDAITSMSFEDARKILFGKEDAATRYLDASSRQKLYEAFLPVIQDALDEVNARTYWKSIVEKYNSLPFTAAVNSELDNHVNNKALDGLFSLIEKKEQRIRIDVSERTSPLLKDVFAQID